MLKHPYDSFRFITSASYFDYDSPHWICDYVCNVWCTDRKEILKCSKNQTYCDYDDRLLCHSGYWQWFCQKKAKRDKYNGIHQRFQKRNISWGDVLLIKGDQVYFPNRMNVLKREIHLKNHNPHQKGQIEDKKDSWNEQPFSHLAHLFSSEIIG